MIAVWQIREFASTSFAFVTSTLDQPTRFPVQFESFERRAVQHAADAFDGLDNIRETRRTDPFDHQNTSAADSSIRFFRRGCKLLRVMMSVF